jgi:hypothetical protein
MAANVSACPSLDTLERLLAEKLTGDERSSVEAHVESCIACQGQLERFVAATSGCRPRPCAGYARSRSLARLKGRLATGHSAEPLVQVSRVPSGSDSSELAV